MSDALPMTKRFRKNERPIFTDWPRWFAMWCNGTCLEPVIPDGANIIFDKEAPYQAGDYVVVWALQSDGLVAPLVKRLVMNIMPCRFPHVCVSEDDLSPVVMFETLNPQRRFCADARAVYGIHKCIGWAPRRADVPNGTEVPVDAADVHWFGKSAAKKPRQKRAPRVAAA